MSLLPPVVATLLADTKQYSAEMAKADATMGKFGATATASGSKFTAFANKASTAVIAAGAVIGVTAIKMAGDFQASITALATGAGESVKNLALVKAGILQMAGQVGQTPIDLAKGMYLIESAGFHGAAGLNVLRASAEGAKIGSADMATVAGAVTSVLHDYSLGAQHANAVTSALVQTVASGKTTLEALGSALGKVLPAAAALGISYAQVGAGLAVQTNTGMSARLASMHLNALLTSLAAPSAGMIKTWKVLGVSVQSFRDMLTNPKQGLAYALDFLDAKIKANTHGSAEFAQGLKSAYGTAANFSTVMAIAGTHTAEFNANVQSIGARMKSVKPDVQGWALVQKELNFQLDKLKGAGTSTLIGIGDWLLPKATKVAEWANGLIAYFKAHPLIGKIASDAAIGLFVASVAYKLGKAVAGVFNFVKGLFTGSALTANTVATQENTAALLKGAGASVIGGGEMAAGGAAGMGMTFGKAVGVFGAGVLSFAATSALLRTSFGKKVGGWITAGGSLNPINDIANLFASKVNATPNKYNARNLRIIAAHKKVTVTHRTKFAR